MKKTLTLVLALALTLCSCAFAEQPVLTDVPASAASIAILRHGKRSKSGAEKVKSPVFIKSRGATELFACSG